MCWVCMGEGTIKCHYCGGEGKVVDPNAYYNAYVCAGIAFVVVIIVGAILGGRGGGMEEEEARVT